MFRRWLLGAALLVGLFAAAPDLGQRRRPAAAPRFYYYPYYYYPHSYWPQNSPQWPEPQGHPYMRPPAYMAYPPFQEPGWRYELWTPMKYYRGQPLLAGPVLRPGVRGQEAGVSGGLNRLSSGSCLCSCLT